MKRFTKQFALCLNDEGNEASLIVGAFVESCALSRERSNTAGDLDA